MGSTRCRFLLLFLFIALYLTHSFPPSPSTSYERYCGLLEKLIKNGVNKLSEKASRIVAPKLRAKLEAAINTAIGSVVRIPLKL